MPSRLLRILLLAIAWSAGSAAIAQEVAGRVLVAAGVVVIQRGADKIPAVRGTEVRTGDTVLTGEKSNAQLRLSDESIVALNSSTTFKLTEYAFKQREPKQQSVFFDLLRGGLRTITGLIGRSQRDRYAVRTPTATVGIRGTHYALRYCNNDCYEGGSASASAEPIRIAAAEGADIGPLAQAGQAGTGILGQNGTYGAVTDGRVNVKNQAGEFVFGADQYFFVANQQSPVRQLIAPPTFLRDTLEGRASVQDKKPAAGGQPPQQQGTAGEGGENAPTVAQTGLGGGSGDVGVSAATTTSTVPPVLEINPFVVTEAAVVGGGLGSIASLPGEGIVLYRLTGGQLSGACASGPPCELQVAEIRIGFNLQQMAVQGLINVVDLEDGGAFNLSTGLQLSLPVVDNNGVLSFSGTLTQANGAILRCESCGIEGEPSQLQSLSVNGTIAGGNLTLTFTGVLPDGDAGTFSVVLPQAPLPTTPVAAIAYPSFGSSNPNQVTQSSGLDNAVDGSGLLRYGWVAGGPQGSRGSATPVIVGSDASAGNLVWGKWTGPGAQIVDGAYNSFTTAGGRVDWIYGDPALVSNVSSLGTVTYTPVGWSLNNGTGVLNSASLTANFTTRQIDFDVNATNTSFGNTFQLSGSTLHGVATTRFQGSLVGTCSGSCSSESPSVPASGGFAGFIAGSAGEGAGVAMSAGTGVQGQGISGVIGFKR